MPFNQQMGVPVELTLRSVDGSAGPLLCAEPIAELQRLRTGSRRWEHARLVRDVAFESAQLGVGAGEPQAAGYDVFVKVAVGDAERIEFSLCGFALTWERATRLLDGTMPLPVREGAIAFRAIVDRPSIEVFSQGGEAILVRGGLMDRAAPTIRVVARGGSASIERLEVFGLRGIWRDP
jgi:sucrose-6-phosphate hydrolase SacC (GH32 family)